MRSWPTDCHPTWTCFSMTTTTPCDFSPLSLHDALPISRHVGDLGHVDAGLAERGGRAAARDELHVAVAKRPRKLDDARSEEHTSELQSRLHLVCRHLLEKKKRDAKEASDFILDATTEQL